MAEEEKKPKKIVPKKYPMPEQDPKERVHNFNEVPIGQDAQTAIAEAQRCLQCKRGPNRKVCMDGCPVEIDIPRFIKQVQLGEFAEAIRIIRENQNLPAVCGRVCPYENQCEGFCIVGKKNEPVGIGRLERFLADWERREQKHGKVEVPPPTGKKVAVVGGGPAGLTVAGDLAKLGHKVTVFEALQYCGGVLIYGIPEFRLPKEIVRAEVDYLRRMGVEIHNDYVIGKLETVDELLKSYDAVFVGTGAGLPDWTNLKGENLNGIMSANEFLTRVNLMKAFKFPEYDTPIRVGDRVVTIGGGNVAMDCARTSLRLGCKESVILYRRSDAELPARREEIHHAKDEGVRFELLAAPLEFIGDAQGNVQQVKAIRMQLGEPDASGRRRPVKIPGSEFLIDAQTVLIAIGQSPNPLVPMTTPDLKTTKEGTIAVDENGRTSKMGVFAGGDIASGAATVILAMGDGKRAAKAMHKFITGDRTWPAPEVFEKLSCEM
ncbi:MAG: NADPH-dependent glutamate synthase [Thermoplasmata archaeon]|jgi:glutamate synthase (NADPH/NADH) small chain|nr:NADPH-dependent glutamate synthase [Thermoplasmata archaeon]